MFIMTNLCTFSQLLSLLKSNFIMLSMALILLILIFLWPFPQSYHLMYRNLVKILNFYFLVTLIKQPQEMKPGIIYHKFMIKRAGILKVFYSQETMHINSIKIMVQKEINFFKDFKNILQDGLYQYQPEIMRIITILHFLIKNLIC